MAACYVYVNGHEVCTGGNCGLDIGTKDLAGVGDTRGACRDVYDCCHGGKRRPVAGEYTREEQYTVRLMWPDGAEECRQVGEGAAGTGDKPIVDGQNNRSSIAVSEQPS